MPERLASATVLMNRQSGFVLQRSRRELEARVREAFARHDIKADVVFVKARELQGAIARAPDTTDHVLVVAGGDGSVNACIAALAVRRGPTAILPLGTLNLLARDIGMSGVLEDDIARIADGEPVAVDVVEVNDHRFHSIAGLGFFAVMAVQREEARKRFPFSRSFGFVWAATRSLVLTRPIEVEIEIDGAREAIVADAIVVTNNRFEGTPWRRATLDAGEIEVHLLSFSGRLARLKALVALMRGRWRELPSLTTRAATALTLRRSGARARLVAMDGELRRVRGPFRFRSSPRALTLRGVRQDAAATAEPEPVTA